MDIVGKLPQGKNQKTFLLVMTDYFSKWVEAEALKQVRDTEVISFVWRKIICRFGVPREIMTDNGAQFTSLRFQDFCKEWGIRLQYSTPRYPQANGQAEASNKTIVNTLKKKLSQNKKAWVDELPAVLWSYRTTARTTTGHTPFSLAYGSEAVIPAEVGIPTARIDNFDEEQNDQQLTLALDLLEEKRDEAALRLASYQQQAARYYNRSIRTRTLQIGDLVLRKVFQNTQEVGAGKLGPNWEGPYIIRHVVGNGAYKLATPEGREIGNSWNIVHLKKYHS